MPQLNAAQCAARAFARGSAACRLLLLAPKMLVLSLPMNVAAEPWIERPALRLALPGAFILALFMLSLSTRIATVPPLATAFWCACGFLTAWFLLLMVRARHAARPVGVELQVIRVHWVQMLVHSTIYTYWGLYWPFIYGQVPLLVAQILFAYAFSMLLSWSRGDTYRLGFGPVPIVLSTNLFLTFKDEWFFWQFGLIALGMLGKEFIRWNKEGRSAHIFNPSAFSLFVFSLVLIATGKTGLTWGNEIAVNLEMPDNIFFVLFFLGLVVQALFRVTLVTLGAAVALYVLGTLYTAATGVYWFLDAGIPIAVFLGLHLLVTDPATSPRTDLGRFIFGLGYGAGVFALYGLLEWAGVPRFYDKLLCVPLLNLTVRMIDHGVTRATWLDRLSPPFLQRFDPARRNLVYMGLWIALFSWMAATQFIGARFPGRATAFWEQACAAGRHNGCRELAQIHADNCSDGHAEACGVLSEALLAGRWPSSDPLQLVRTLARSCDLGVAQSCSSLTRALGPEQRLEVEAACTRGTAGSCYVVAMTQLMGLGTAPDRAAALRNYEIACDRGLATACGVMADMYRYGVGVARDSARALAGHERACSLAFAPSCVTLALMLTSGDGGARDERRAAALYQRACLLGLTKACGGPAASGAR
jgi:Sel1 repeat-containing protein